MDHREAYIRENFDHLVRVRAGLRGMSAAQIRAVNRAVEAIDETLDYSLETLDVRLSDLASLRSALYKLQHNFRAEPAEHQRESFAEFGLDYTEADQ
jgi:hypothetical protein